jgi:HTH-type transcriptional regulator, transcriptional repressor of NAD biosynthesis genes
MKPRVGLTLGKYAPLHRGHELVIRTALREVDRLVVMIYDCPEITPVPLAMRARWITDLYPAVEVIQARGAPLEVGDTPEIKRSHEEFILRALAGRRITHFYSSEFYGEHVSAALGAIDRRVDPERRMQPISATQLRADPYQHRNYVSPRVYRDLVCNIAVLGAPSTGKTTLCQALGRSYQTSWMPEYGREYWERHQIDRRLTPEQLVELAEGHLEREEQMLLRSNRYLFTDTNALTTLLFARHYHGRAPARLAELADHTAQRYQRTFVCGDEIPYEATWDRSGAANRAAMQAWTLEELERRRIAYVVLGGSVEERLRRARDEIGKA